MKIIKEYCPSSKMCVIRTDDYGRSLTLINALAKEAYKDCPEITADNIRVVQFAGSHYARSYGIEFIVKVRPPIEYREINQLEYIF